MAAKANGEKMPNRLQAVEQALRTLATTPELRAVLIDGPWGTGNPLNASVMRRAFLVNTGFFAGALKFAKTAAVGLYEGCATRQGADVVFPCGPPAGLALRTRLLAQIFHT